MSIFFFVYLLLNSLLTVFKRKMERYIPASMRRSMVSVLSRSHASIFNLHTYPFECPTISGSSLFPFRICEQAEDELDSWILNFLFKCTCFLLLIKPSNLLMKPGLSERRVGGFCTCICHSYSKSTGLYIDSMKDA